MRHFVARQWMRRVAQCRCFPREIGHDATAAKSIAGPQNAAEDYLNATYGIRSWLLTTDHKRIALLYLGSGRSSFSWGHLATMIRIHLLT